MTPTQRTKRKLAAILSADVKNFSLLMGKDEVGTVATLKRYKEVLAKLVADFGGRVVDSPGDNLLAEFASVVDALECSLAFQSEIKKKNAAMAESRRMEFRIGINLGDVIEDEGRIYGDGVNIAARLENLTPPGGVCISGTVYDHIGGSLRQRCESFGEMQVKNIRHPVRVYCLRMPGMPPPKPALQEIAATEDPHRISEPTFRPFPEFSPIVGREKELSVLHTGLSRLKEERGLLFCISGEPGLGKTTLVETFLAELSGEGGSPLILRGKCSERLAGAEAYLPLLDALSSLLRPRDSEVPSLMKGIAPTWYAQLQPLDREDPDSAGLLSETRSASQARRKYELGNLLRELALRRPLVLFLDDLHWADASTVDMLAYLGAQFHALPILILVTARLSYLLSRNHPFLQVKQELEAHGQCRELPLGYLERPDIEHYLAREFPGHRFSDDFVEMLHSRTEGSPMFLVDLLGDLRARQVIVKEEDGWTLTNPLHAIEDEIPASIRSMVARKVESLNEIDRRLLSTASVQGYEFDSAVLSRVLEMDPATVEERLGELERVHAFIRLMREEELPDGTLSLRCRFVHVLYQNFLFSSLPLTRRVELSAGIANLLQNFLGEGNRGSAAELAHLWMAARQYQRAAVCFLHAARSAALINAHREAKKLAERGVEALGRLPESNERDRYELELLLVLGLSLQAVQSWSSPEAEQAFKRAHRLCRKAGDDPQLFSALHGISRFYSFRAEMDSAQEVARELLGIAEKGNYPALQLAALNTQGLLCFCRGEEFPRLEDILRELVLGPKERADSRLVEIEDVRITAHVASCFHLWKRGQPDRAVALARDGLALAERFSHPFSRAGVHNLLGFLHLFRKEWLETCRQGARVIALAQKYDLGVHRFFGELLQAIGSAYMAPEAEGTEKVRRAIETWRNKGLGLFLPLYLGCLAELSLLTGRVDEGLSAAEEALATSARTGERFWVPELHRLKGELLLQETNAGALDRESEAEDDFHKALTVARKQGTRGLELRAAMSLGRMWRRQNREEEARRLISAVRDAFTEGFTAPDLLEAEEFLTRTPSRPSTEPELPGKPSVAVLPFLNMSGDPEQEYFSDGITEDIITDLAKASGLFVIARNSVFSYKGKAVPPERVGRELGVRYLLEGSIRKAGERVRISAQLIDSRTGGHLWAERFDRVLDDIFAVQEEVARNIVSNLAVRLTEEERERLGGRSTTNVAAYDCYLRGLEFLHRYTREGLSRARPLFKRAVELDPGFAPALTELGRTHWQEWIYGRLRHRKGLEKAFQCARQALAVDEAAAEAHCLLGDVCLWRKQHGEAIAAYEQAIYYQPNNADALAGMGSVLAFAGKPEEAIDWILKGMRLNPVFPIWYLLHLGHAQLLAGKLEDAVASLERATIRNPDYIPSFMFLAACYIRLERRGKALAMAEKVRRMDPEFLLENWRRKLPYKDRKTMNSMIEALRAAGLETDPRGNLQRRTLR